MRGKEQRDRRNGKRRIERKEGRKGKGKESREGETRKGTMKTEIIKGRGKAILKRGESVGWG